VTLRYRSLLTITAVGIGLALGWGLGTQEIQAQDAKASEKKWQGKDGGQEEFGLAQAISKAADAKGRLAALDKWKQAFPQSDYSDIRDEQYLFVYQEANMNRQAFDQAVTILKTRPNHFYALRAMVTLVQGLMPVQPADLDNASRISTYIMDNLDAAFAPANRPETIKEADWPAIKPAMKAAAHNAYLWTITARKDNPRAETELTAYLKKDPTQASTSYSLAGAMLAQNQQHPEKQPAALYHFARAAANNTPNALPAAAQKQALEYITKTYTAYHGGSDGLQDLLAMARTNPFPPDGFTIKSKSDLAIEVAKKQAEADAANPIFAFWRDLVKDPLLKDGDTYFDAMKGALLPGEPGKAKGFTKFKAKLISMTPASKPKELVLALEKPDVADVTLKFEDPLPGNMEPGAELEFEGVPDGYRKEPFMVTFLVTPEQLSGWTGTNPKAAPKGKGPAKGPATKSGAAKAKTK
jgi:hypothetical protein